MIRRKNIYVFLLILLIAMFSAACGINTAKEDNSRPAVAVSILPQKTFVQWVAGELVDVVNMIPAGNSPANYAPSPKEMQQLSDASIYFSIGVPAEQANILAKARDINKNIKIVDLAQKVAQVYPDREFSPGQRDPHIWLSPKRVEVMVDVIADELCELDADNAKVYRQNAQQYKQKLDKLDEYIRNTLQDVKQRSFIVYHPAFGYFADDYGLQMIAVEENGKQATAKRLQEIIDIARQKDIKVIFYQAEIDSGQSKALADELAGKTEMIQPLSPDYIENLKKMADTFKDVLEGE